MDLDLKRRFVDFYVRHIQKTAARRADKVRELQAAASRTEEQVVRFEVYELDVRQRGIVKQEVYVYVVRVDKTGRIETLPASSRPDVRVMTDVSTLWGFANGRIDLTIAGVNGDTPGRKHIEPFTPRDAVRLGLLETDGSGSALKNLFLLERTVMPQLAEDLRLPRPPDR